MRADVYLVERGVAASRTLARRLIEAGAVLLDGRPVEKPAQEVPPGAHTLEVGESRETRYVGRGGLKLEAALDAFPVPVAGGVFADIGASTGGFTDCMLQNGAARVYAVDVGYGQLDWKLRNDPRVVCLERTNARYLDHEQVPDVLDFASVDVSFISLTKVLIPARELLRDGGEMVCLIKPQFEAGREKVGKKGVVREPATHAEVLHMAQGYAMANHFTPAGLDFSPIKGPEGNIEFLMYVQHSQNPQPLPEGLIEQTVANAHAALDKAPNLH